MGPGIGIGGVVGGGGAGAGGIGDGVAGVGFQMGPWAGGARWGGAPSPLPQLLSELVTAIGREDMAVTSRFREFLFLKVRLCVCVCVIFPSILDINGRTSRGHTGGRSHRIFNPPSFCGACLDFCREKDSAIPFPRRP